jgi:hypothetical protein
MAESKVIELTSPAGVAIRAAYMGKHLNDSLHLEFEYAAYWSCDGQERTSRYTLTERNDAAAFELIPQHVDEVNEAMANG